MTRKPTRLTALMYWATFVALLLCPLVIGLMVWLAPGAEPPIALPEGYGPDNTRLRLAALAALPSGIALFWTLHRMHLLFGQFRSHEPLSNRTARLIRQIGSGLLVVAVLRVLAVPVQSLILTLPAPEGSRMISVSFGSADLGFLLAAGLLAVIGWAMEDAAHLAEENRGFV